MKKSDYIKSSIMRTFYNSTELLARALIARKLPKDMTIEKNISYGTGPHERLNIIYKREMKKLRPLFLYIHGGGWISGSHGMRNTYCSEFVKEGFFAANVDYEYAPNEIFPFQIQQCLNAIDWIYDNADRYNIDMSKILLAGESAGSYFTTYLISLSNDHSLYETHNLHFRHKKEFVVTALLSNCGAIDILRLTDSTFPQMKLMIKCFTGMTIEEIKSKENEERVRNMSPRITANFPPTMIIFAQHDSLRSESFVLKRQLDAFGIPCKIFEGTGLISMHAFPIATVLKKGKACLYTTMKFLLPFFYDKLNSDDSTFSADNSTEDNSLSADNSTEHN